MSVLRAVTLDEVKSFVGDGLEVMMHRAFAATGAPFPENARKTLIDDILAFYKTQRASPEQLYPLVQETLHLYKAKGVKIGLCTNKMYAPTIKLLGEIGIADQFDFIAGSDTFPVFKPDPGHVLGVVRAMKCSPSTCVMIGDSINDIEAARGAKVASIAVSHGYGRDVHSLGAGAVIADFGELPNALRALGFNIGV
jgi:phosphoglycolate phosphatase